MNEGSISINKGTVFVLLSAIFFATGGLLIKLNTWSSYSINGVRCLFAFMVMAVYMKVIHHKFVVNLPVLFTAVANYGMALTFVMANKMTTAANAIVLQFTMPIFIILMLWVFWKKKPDRAAVAACLVSFFGILCFFYESLSAGGMAGNLMAVFSGFLYAIVFVSKKIKGSDFESSVLISFLNSFFSAIPSIVKEPEIMGMNLFLCMLLGVCQMGLAFICLAKGLETVQPVTASLISMIEPILNPILVALVCGEKIGIIALIGAVIVLGSALFYNIHDARSTVKTA